MKRPRRYKTILPRIASAIIDGIVFIPISILENRFTNTSEKMGFVTGTLFFFLVWVCYRVYMHGRYGQTLGKMASHVKVFSTGEKSIVSYWDAFLRECPGLGAVIFCLAYLLVSPGNAGQISGFEERNYGILLYYVYGGLSIAEIIVALVNPKHRSVHDMIAGTVVLDVTKYKKWEMEYEEVTEQGA